MVFCGDLEGWDGVDRCERGPRGKGDTHTHTHTHVIDFIVQQKLTDHCKATIL